MTAGANGSINRTARLAGGLHLSVLPFGFFSFVYVPSVLLAGGDAATIAPNITESGRLIRSGTASHLISPGIPGLPTISRITFIAELVLPAWILIKGVDLDRRPAPATR